MLKIKLCICILLLALVGILWAQESEIEALPVAIEAEDGITLRGGYFAVSESDGPAVLLLHQLYTTRASWNTIINPLLAAGYKVLAVDLRGYGQTRGRINWTQAQDDVRVWTDWLGAQPGVNSVTLMGSSMGSSLALTGCALTESCDGVVALSPGLNYFQVWTGEAVQAGKPILIVYADHDPYPARDVPEMQTLGGDSVTVQVYEGREHGIDLFRSHEDLLPLVIAWMSDH